MPPSVRYHTLIKQFRTPEAIRRDMVTWYDAHRRNASATARMFRTKRQTVEKWVRRFSEEGSNGLRDRSRAPKTHPNQIPAADEEAILALKARLSFAGVNRLQIEGIPHSTSTIGRVLREHGCTRRRRKRYQRRRMLAEVKRRAKALRFWQVDVKYLDDIGGLWPFIEAKAIPRYEYTARDVRTGTTFCCYAWEIGILQTARFVRLLLDHLQRHGVTLRDVTIQTDNGSENIGSLYAKRDRLVSRLIEERFHAVHQTIPIRQPRFNSHVESFHGIIERELYTQEYLPTVDALLGKATAYLAWFNGARRNLETRKTPWELVKQQAHLLDASFLTFPPIILDHLPWFADALLRGVPYVADEVIGEATRGPREGPA